MAGVEWEVAVPVEQDYKIQGLLPPLEEETRQQTSEPYQQRMAAPSFEDSRSRSRRRPLALQTPWLTVWQCNYP